ncbi:ATP-binding protein [Novipirellula galeiformis]|uniref:ATP-binding protein n=1 Tax=Novipirellula galeiformis TaxID=2528004 RepID=UPI0011B642AA|nr:ATP-binding protein [Novipirellula galeiformis]
MDFQPSNPFCTRIVRPGAIPYQFDGDRDAAAVLQDLVGRLLRSRYHLVVGPHGSGKSTLVRELVPHLKRGFAHWLEVQLHSNLPRHGDMRCPPRGPKRWFAQWMHWRRMHARVAAQQSQAPRGSLLIIDGLEQLSLLGVFATRWRAKRSGHAVLATSHREHAGFETLINTTLRPHKIVELTEFLIASLAEPEQERVRRELGRRSLGPQTNLRDLWFDFYDLIETSRRQPYASSLDRCDRPNAPVETCSGESRNAAG